MAEYQDNPLGYNDVPDDDDFVPPLVEHSRMKVAENGYGAAGTIRICHMTDEGTPYVTVEPVGLEFTVKQGLEFIDLFTAALDALES